MFDVQCIIQRWWLEQVLLSKNKLHALVVMALRTSPIDIYLSVIPQKTGLKEETVYVHGIVIPQVLTHIAEENNRI